jgi:hypothetical protein
MPDAETFVAAKQYPFVNGGTSTMSNVYFNLASGNLSQETHWQISFNGGTSHEVITFSNGAAIDASDFLFA